MWLLMLTAFAIVAAITTAANTTEIIIFLPLRRPSVSDSLNVILNFYDAKVARKPCIAKCPQGEEVF